MELLLSSFLYPSKLDPFLSHSRLARAQDSLCSICHLQFAEDVRDMVAHCLQAENKLLGDFLVGASLRNQCEDLNFALRQFREDLGWRGGSDIREETDQSLGNARTKDGFAVRNRPDRREHFGLIGALDSRRAAPAR